MGPHLNKMGPYCFDDLVNVSNLGIASGNKK